MKHLPVLIVFIVAFHITANAQYYYRDIISPQQALKEKKSLELQKIRSVIVHSFDPDGTEIKDFSVEKKFSKDYKEAVTNTSSKTMGENRVVSSYNAKGFLSHATDSSELSVTNTTYEYDANDRISKITSVTQSSDDDFHTSLTEVHQYSYNDKGLPVKMLKIKNQKDSSLIDFIIDEKGNVTDEIEPGRNGKHYYYYYDDKKRLTDIVKYNVMTKGLAADFIFGYDDENRLVKMITVAEGGTANYETMKYEINYNTWQYIYNDGLKIIEKCFSKNKDLLGYVEYEYLD